MRGPLAAGLRRVLLDTSGYFCAAVPQDAGHTQAVRALEVLAQRPSWLFTTNFILAEVHALLLNRRGRYLAARVLTEIDQSNTTVVRVSRRDELRARQIIHQYADKDFSLTDATSFAIMECLHIGAAFSFDRNLAQFGSRLLGPSD